MTNLITKYPRAFALAVIFHVIAAGAFVVNFHFDQKPVITPKQVDVVQATMVDESQVQAELNKLKALEDKKRKSETDRQKKLDREAEKARKKRLQEQKKLKELERKRKKELEKKKKLEKERKTAEKKLKEEDRKRKLAEDKRKKAEKAAKVAEQKRLKEVERQRVAEDNRKKAEAKRKKAEAERKKAEAERKRAEEIERKAKEKALAAIEAQQRADDEKARQRLIDEENKRLQSARSKKEGKVINRYMGLIQKQVANSWREPATMKSTDSCIVFVRMMPTGDVLQVEAKKCTGDNIFKRSVEDAVRKAAPLPLPPNKSLFKHFREINFKFNKPQK